MRNEQGFAHPMRRLEVKGGGRGEEKEGECLTKDGVSNKRNLGRGE